MKRFDKEKTKINRFHMKCSLASLLITIIVIFVFAKLTYENGQLEVFSLAGLYFILLLGFNLVIYMNKENSLSVYKEIKTNEYNDLHSTLNEIDEKYKEKALSFFQNLEQILNFEYQNFYNWVNTDYKKSLAIENIKSIKLNGELEK